MSYSNVENSLSESTSHFDEIVTRREKLIKDSRDVISLSARTIVSIHSADFSDAKELKGQAREHLEELRKVAGKDLTRYLLTPEQEFVECSVMYAVATRSNLPSRKQLGVSHSSYVLGLLDAIGELKRSIYDAIRQDNFTTAENMFSIMERLYLLLSPFAVYDNIAQGVKRKLDVARMLIEDVRATVTEEARRKEFVAAVNELAEKLGKKPVAQRATRSKDREAFTDSINTSNESPDEEGSE